MLRVIFIFLTLAGISGLSVLVVIRLADGRRSTLQAALSCRSSRRVAEGFLTLLKGASRF